MSLMYYFLLFFLTDLLGGVTLPSSSVLYNSFGIPASFWNFEVWGDYFLFSTEIITMQFAYFLFFYLLIVNLLQHACNISYFYWFTAKLVIIANNCPPLRKSEIEYYAMLAKVTVHHFHGSKFASLIRFAAW
jgi:hypothetical protein